MKCLILIAALCCLGVCAGDSLSLDFLTDNLLNPMLTQIQNNAVSMLQQQLLGLISGIFGKRGVSDVLNINLNQVLAPFIGQVKDAYQNLFKVFLSIVQNVGDYIRKPDWARIEFITAAAEAQNVIAKLKLNVEFLQPLVSFVQKHLGALIADFEKIIVQIMSATSNPIQSLIGQGNLLQP